MTIYKIIGKVTLLLGHVITVGAGVHFVNNV